MAKVHKGLSSIEIFKRFIFITIGSVLMGVALELFLVPNNVIDGGIAGISIMLAHLTSLPLGVFLFIVNVPFLILGYKQIGKTFAISTLYGIIVMSVTTSLLHHVEAFTEEKLLAVLFGGLILGVGVGLAIRFGGSLDGVEIVSILISKKLRMPRNYTAYGTTVTGQRAPRTSPPVSRIRATVPSPKIVAPDTLGTLR